MGDVVPLKKPDYLQAFADEFCAAKRPYQRIAALKRYGTRRRFEQLIPIITLEDALDWGDGWEKSYAELRRVYYQHVEELQAQFLYAKVDLACEQAERLIERIALQDEIKRLRALI